MEIIQHILVYITLGFSAFYVVNKFLIPKSVWGDKKSSSKKGCGQSDCGCN